VKDKGAASPEAWGQLQNSQVTRFYRSPSAHRSSIEQTRGQLPID